MSIEIVWRRKGAVRDFGFRSKRLRFLLSLFRDASINSSLNSMMKRKAITRQIGGIKISEIPSKCNIALSAQWEFWRTHNQSKQLALRDFIQLRRVNISTYFSALSTEI